MKTALLKGGGIAAVIALLVGATFLFFQNQPETAEDTDLTFTVSPHEVEVIVDDESYGTVATGDTVTVPLRSEAQIEVTREGFVPYSATMEINPGASHSVEVELHPQTRQAEELLEEEQELTAEQSATERQLDAADDAYEEYPILSDLPRHEETYSAYQGLTNEAGHDFGIHLYVYEGSEEQGREDFEDWLNSEQYSPDDYDIIEEIQEDDQQTAQPNEPSWSDLQEMSVDDIEVTDDFDTEGMNYKELALLFSETSVTWDTGQDSHPTDGLLRTTALMTDDLADTVEAPHRPTTTPTWREAATYDAQSFAWASYYEEEDRDNGADVEVDVCWAWISHDGRIIVDGPRELELSIVDTSYGPHVEEFTYVDPDPFVDNSTTSCHPEDAPQ